MNHFKWAEVSPSTYGLLQNCQAASAGVERSFSMLGKILDKDRNFLPNNVEKYLILHFNSVIKWLKWISLAKYGVTI